MKNPGGRPTKYDPAYCEAVVDFMAEGYSLEAFAGQIGVGERTIYDWIEKHPKFSQAIKRGRAAGRKFWEAMGIEGAWGGKQFNPTVWIFNMKNRYKEDWRDSHDLTSDGKRINTLYDLLKETDREPEGED